MKKWVVDLAYRVDGKYVEERVIVEADKLLDAYFAGLDLVIDRRMNENWTAFAIWNVGILAEADEEVV